MTSLSDMLKAADLIYNYSDEDKAIIRQMAKEDKAGLIAALEADYLVRLAVQESGIVEGY